MSEIKFDRQPIIEGCETPLPPALEQRLQWVEDLLNAAIRETPLSD